MTEWDDYWSEKSTVSKRIYDVIAVVYRAVIIKPNLRNYLRKYFKQGDRLLHAGCGGGGVESENNGFKIVAFDISGYALAEYRSRHPDIEIRQGTILDTGIGDNTFDGIYNLGVMEHFNDEDIQTILKEFRRIVKPGGTVILFWAHTMGITVIFLRYLHYFLNTILHHNVNFHPAEPSLVQSDQWIQDRLKNTGFKTIAIDFNVANLYTYMVIVLKKGDT
jgi:ubiquinone/menaquinone biosynthesis C-methylase UbiE